MYWLWVTNALKMASKLVAEDSATAVPASFRLGWADVLRRYNKPYIEGRASSRTSPQAERDESGRRA